MLAFEPNGKYSRADIRERVGLQRHMKGGNWDTGIVEHDNAFLIFANVDTEGRTGHNYGNRWEPNGLRWYHKNGSHLGWQSVQRLLEDGREIHVFWRTSNQAPFEYAGTAKAAEIADISPVEILWSFDVGSVTQPALQSPEQVTPGIYFEGAVRSVLVNAYERDRMARQACVDHFGTACAVCCLRFEERYGALGIGFIHVHHVIPLSGLGPDYEIDPIEDLRPVCPNCHAMLHRRRPPLSIEELRSALK